MIRIRQSPIPATLLPPGTRARLMGISSLAALNGAMATAPRPTLAAMRAEIDRLDPK